MRQHAAVSNKILIVVTILAGAVWTSGASAETLDLSCMPADSTQVHHIVVDLSSGLVFNDSDRGSRRWAAVITDKDVTWDEVYDSRAGHSANHYVLDRQAGTLHGTDVTHGGTGHEVVNAMCQKTS